MYDDIQSGKMGLLLCILLYVTVLVSVLKVPAVCCVNGCLSCVVLCISLNVLTGLCQVARVKTGRMAHPYGMQLLQCKYVPIYIKELFFACFLYT